MELGIAVRSMGPQSAPDVLLACVRAAEDAGLADVWIQDHIAIPPDDAEGSGGRVGGSGEHALRRTVDYGDGWMPMTGDPEQLAPAIARLGALAEAAGRDLPAVVAFVGLDPTRPESLRERIDALAELGVSRVVVGARYADAGEFSRQVDQIAAHALPEVARR